MLVTEHTVRQLESEHERHKRVSAAQEKVLLQYLDNVNNGIMTLEEFIDKTDNFADYWNDVAVSAAMQKPIQIPKRLANRIYK